MAMATAASGSARRNIDTTRSPLRSAHATPARTPTPRPSISPLSTTSRPTKCSPTLTKNTRAENGEALPDANLGDNGFTIADGVMDPDDSRSSSLSEPEVDDDLQDEMLEDTLENLTSTGRAKTHKLAEVDSEAETERLEETPEKQRKHADSTGRTPSKLRQAATAEEELSDALSPLLADLGAASSTSTIAAGTQLKAVGRGKEAVIESSTADATPPGLKRKRSDAAEDSPLTSQDSDLEESPRKRSRESSVGKAELDAATANAVADDIGPLESPLSQFDEPPNAKISKGVKGKKGKQKGRKAKGQLQVPDGYVQDEDILGNDEEAKERKPVSGTELQWKETVSFMFDNSGKSRQGLRSQVVESRLVDIDKELSSLSQPESTHPEYLRSVACIDSRREKQQREAHAYYAYKMRAIQERTLGERAQLHSQYFQQVREQREEVLYKLGEDWYAIQQERRQQHLDDDARYMYKFPTKKSVQVRQQAKYNQEVSVLSGVAKYIGFPAAPSIEEVKGGNLEADLRAMKLSRRISYTAPAAQQRALPQQTQQQLSGDQQSVLLSAPTKPPANYSERRAHEQFLEQNAWARPQQTVVPAYGTPNLMHTADWVDQPTGPRHLMRNMSGHGLGNGGPVYSSRNSSPFATPMLMSRHLPPEQSDGPEMPSSVLAAPPTEGRLLHHGQGVFASSPLQVTKQRPNGTHASVDLPGGSRDPSREVPTAGSRIISGTSTIDAPLSAEKSTSVTYDHQPRHDGAGSMDFDRNDLPRREDAIEMGPSRPYTGQPFRHGHRYLPMDGGTEEGRLGVGG